MKAEIQGIAGAEIGTATWSAQAGPYCVDSTVTVTTRLTIEAGASVYAAAGATLQVALGAALTAQGTAAAPVLLTARDTLAGWGGISAIYEDAVVGATDEGRPALTLTHVRLEHAGKNESERAIDIEGGSFQMDSSTVRPGRIWLVRPNGRILGSTIDSAGLFFTYGGTFAIESSVLRGGAPLQFGAAIFCEETTTLHLRDVRVEGAPGEGIVMDEDAACELDGVGVVLTGNGFGALLVGPSALDSCEVSGNSWGGISAVGTVSIHHCNLHDNGGAGVANGDVRDIAPMLDARFNWWGDAAGPNGPNGDGVQGAVDWSQPLAAPVILPPLGTTGAQPTSVRPPPARSSAPSPARRS